MLDSVRSAANADGIYALIMVSFVVCVLLAAAFASWRALVAHRQSTTNRVKRAAWREAHRERVRIPADERRLLGDDWRDRVSTFYNPAGGPKGMYAERREP